MTEKLERIKQIIEEDKIKLDPVTIMAYGYATQPSIKGQNKEDR